MSRRWLFGNGTKKRFIERHSEDQRLGFFSSCLRPTGSLRLRVVVLVTRACRWWLSRRRLRLRSRRRRQSLLNVLTTRLWPTTRRGLALTPQSQRSLMAENEFRPGLDLATAGRVSFADNFGEHLHPAFLVRAGVGIKVNHLAVAKPDAEALFDKHVALLFLGKGGLATTASLGRRFLLSQDRLVVDQFHCLGQVDRSSWLPGDLVVRRQLRPLKPEVASPPVLRVRQNLAFKSKR